MYIITNLTFLLSGSDTKGNKYNSINKNSKVSNKNSNKREGEEETSFS